MFLLFFFGAIFDRHIRMKTKQILKKVFSAYRVWGEGADFFYRGRPNLNWGKITSDGGTHPSYNLSSSYIFIYGLWSCLITATPLRCEINISY